MYWSCTVPESTFYVAVFYRPGCGKFSRLFLREGEARRSERQQHVYAGKNVEALGLPHEVEKEHAQQEEDRERCKDCDGITVTVSVRQHLYPADQAFCQEKDTACQYHELNNTAYHTGDIVSASPGVDIFEKETADLTC